MQAIERVRVVVRGAVQGVGFRPFVYRLATGLGLSGWVLNSAAGVFVEAEGAADAVRSFVLALDRDRPPRAVIQSLEWTLLDPAGYDRFEIRASVGGETTALVLPDIATCPDCLRELFDPADRRHRYPFTNCTNCGPRYSIILGLPYDRPSTTMAGFVMCEACRAEYTDPRDRRFHAQPNACPACGPRLEAWTGDGRVAAAGEVALAEAESVLRRGGIVAVKGLGGFHLMTDARDGAAVRRLRELKRREEKPFALMFPTLGSVRDGCEVGGVEARLLTSPEAPIVLLRRLPEPQGGHAAAAEVAPGNPTLGIMLPYTPLHHLLLTDLGFPVVATSGNLSDEPICTDEREALARLRGMADLFLVHDRPIARHVDDSIVRVVLDRELVLRRARGFAPLPVPVSAAATGALAVGAHLKSAVAIAVAGNGFISQHIGDLETREAFAAFEQVIAAFGGLYRFDAGRVASDAHPDYLSTGFARRTGRPVTEVQHHLAHVLACMTENELAGPALGVAWDGTGFGADGTIWGGEFLMVLPDRAYRAGHLRTFRLPGGDAAVREPRRSALGLLFAIEGSAVLDRDDLAPVAAWTPVERGALRRALESKVNAPWTSSAGRLFDAVASIAGVRQTCRYEGQAAMALEFALDGVATDEAYPISVPARTAGGGPAGDRAGGPTGMPLVVDWEPLVRQVMDDVSRKTPVGLVSARFHNALVEAIVGVADRVGEPRVVLTGGCFQNRYLTERAVRRLTGAGFRAYWHQRVPPNDGGIALGQLAAVGMGISTVG